MDNVRKGLAVVAMVAAAALGGAAIAGADDNSGNGSSTTASGTAAAASTPSRGSGPRPQRSDETLLTGDVAAKVKAAALAEVAGTVERVETDGDGHAKYEAHITKADGSRATVYVNEQFQVVGSESR